MANFTERKWKYLSITLSALVVALVLAPQADAANPDHNDVLAAINVCGNGNSELGLKFSK
jgi:hypothetical protein